jgi:ABC-type multidrug transport system ATPase subunit
VLLLDEHTAALDPKTAGQILGLTRGGGHRRPADHAHGHPHMNQALRLGNRLIMMHRGRVILDLAGDEKRKLTVRTCSPASTPRRARSSTSDKMLLTNKRLQTEVFTHGPTHPVPSSSPTRWPATRSGAILKMIEAAGLTVKSTKMIHMTKSQAEGF